jgi:hypothetical protein
MKDPKIEEKVVRLKQLITELNELNEFLYKENVSFGIKEKTKDDPKARVFELSYINQTVNY